MKSKKNLLARGALLALLLGAFSIPLLAQDKHQSMMHRRQEGSDDAYISDASWGHPAQTW